MKKTVNSNLIAANAFLSTGQDVLSKKQVIEYVEISSEKINKETEMIVGPFEVDKFIKQYDTILGVDMYDKDIFLRGTNDIEILIANFRKVLPKEVKEILDETGKELMIEESQKVLIKKKG